jgi:hypothetical protein
MEPFSIMYMCILIKKKKLISNLQQVITFDYQCTM